MHRPATPAAEAALAAQDLAERSIERRTHRQHRAMAAVGAGHRAPLLDRRARPDRDRFLALAEVRGRPHQIAAEQVHHLVLEHADLDHAAQQAEEGRTIQTAPTFVTHAHSPLPQNIWYGT